jgi:formylglycine-generating enzyme required for sulfatase activity
MVLVPGGKTKVGTRVEDVEALVREREDLRYALAGEMPQHEVVVDDFYLMSTEVTNEQYASFVEAAQAKPPRSWGADALQAGQAAFLEEQRIARQRAKAAGEPFENRVFDAEAWWEENWKNARWEVPGDESGHPVAFVSYAEAQAYARWAGLRLMTELEFQRAGRREGSRDYPWGKDWDDRRFCHSVHVGRDHTADVGSYPAGAIDGIYDLSGNVWEWTSSPFEPFPGYAPRKITVNKRAVQLIAPFDGSQRVTVSGSYQMDRIGVRLSTRRPADPDQATNALGFRCAASPEAGRDMADWALEHDLRAAWSEDMAAFAPGRALALRKWSTGEARVKLPGYALIRAYQHVLVCPVAEVKALTVAELAAGSHKNGPLLLGFFDLPWPLLQPKVEAGLYCVAWRGAERGAPGQDGEDSVLASVSGFRADQDCYILYSADGAARVAFPAPPVQMDRVRPCSIALEPAAAETPLDTLRVTFALPSSITKGKALVFDVPLRLAPGTVDAGFR